MLEKQSTLSRQQSAFIVGLDNLLCLRLDRLLLFRKE